MGKIVGCILQKNPDIIEPFEAEGCYGPHNEGFPLNYQDNLLKIIKGIRKYDLSTFNEEATKYKIILPLLYHLGWNIYDLKQIFPEYPVKHSTKKVDYLLTDHKNNKIFIEAKKPNVDLDNVKCQIIEYCASKNVNIGIITNGIQWRFYNIEYHDNRLGAIKKWDKDEINLLEDTSEEIIHQLISFFWNDNTCPEGQLYENRSIKTIFTNIKKIKVNEKYLYNESAVKQVIILPLLEDLGWNINNNSEFIFDLYNNGKKVDYVLGKSKNRIFIEVKALTDDLENYDTLEKYEEQILKYGDVAGINFGVLTNGKIWKFYHLKTRDRIKVKIEKKEEINEKFINLLSKEKVDSGFNIKYLEKLA